MVDSRGILEGLLHIYRKMEYCKDLIVLVSERTPESYIRYLEEREYDHIVTGTEHVDLRKALEKCRERYGFGRIAVDSGNTLCGVLLDEGLAHRISLVISPVIVGKEAVNLFGKAGGSGKALKLLECETMDSGHLHLIYGINED
jgi:2,5-diamino-6-(ribosylamino)-4(3H)-pyrimidinone 5'-phosphate reductase